MVPGIALKQDHKARSGPLPESPNRASARGNGDRITCAPAALAWPAKGPSSPSTTQKSQPGSAARMLASKSIKLISAPPIWPDGLR